MKLLAGTYRKDRDHEVVAQPLNEIPPPSVRLDEDGRTIYNQYATYLADNGRLTFESQKIIEDLAYWESMRNQLEIEVKNSGPVMNYYNEDGSLKHSQPSGGFVALKQATAEIDRLRRRLGFEVPEVSSENQKKLKEFYRKGY